MIPEDIPEKAESEAVEKYYKSLIAKAQYEDIVMDSVPIETVERYLTTLCSNLLSALNRFPDRLAARLAVESSEEVIYQILNDEKIEISKSFLALIDKQGKQEVISLAAEERPKTAKRKKPSKQKNISSQ